MSILDYFNWFSSYLIEWMGLALGVALVLRFVAFRSGKSNQVYFRTLSRSVEKNLEKQRDSGDIEDLDLWFEQLLDQVKADLPSRSIRFAGDQKTGGGNFRLQGKKSLSHFMATKRDVIYNIADQLSALRGTYPPNFRELSDRVLYQDPYWRNILAVVPVDMLQRILGVMPGLFVIGGIFGTFIGITGALPMIATIDLSNLEEAKPILNSFVANIAFSMNTSIAGIIFSVALTLLNTMYPLTAVRSEIREGLARSFEHIWNRIHKEKLSPGESEMVGQLNRLCHLVSERGLSASERRP